ncbi:transglycosylase SLT domain-containing protein [uncultured Chitinibacter sp.]|nr:transglycosylase SLT domain-containing protein [uncultured Chitinibacter sp.]
MANPVNRVTAEFLKAKTGTELAQGRNYDASARKSNAEAYQTNQGSNMVLPQGASIDQVVAQIMPALIGQESGGNQSAVSPKGAVGVAQVMKKTGPEAAAAAGLPWDEGKWRGDAAYNETIGRAYFKKQLIQFGDPQLALAAYNAGPGAVQEALQRDKAAGGDGSFASVSRFLPAETRAYVPGVIARMGGFQLKQAKDQDAAATKAVNMTMPDWLRDQFSVQALDERGAPRIDTMSGKPIIDMAATNQRLNQLNAAWEAAGRPPIAEFAARFLVNGPKINQARLSNWGELPQAQPTAQASPMRQVVTMEEVVQTAANRGVSPELVIATLQQRGIQVAPPTAPPRVQAAPQPSAPAPAPAAPKPKPITDNGWKNRTYSDGSEKAKLPTLKLPDMFQLNIQPPQSVYDQKRAQNEQRAQQVSQQLLAKPFMFGG